MKGSPKHNKLPHTVQYNEGKVEFLNSFQFIYKQQQNSTEYNIEKGQWIIGLGCW